MSVIQTILKQKPVEGFIHEKLTSGLAIIKRFELVGGGGSKDDKDNIDTEQYVDLDEYKVASVDKHGWIIHPLPLLMAVGNDRGGVDFHEGNVGYEHVGIWAWHLLSIVDNLPKRFKKLKLTFKEI